MFMEDTAWWVALWQRSAGGDRSWYESILTMLRLDDQDMVGSVPERQPSVRQFEAFLAEATAAKGVRPDSHMARFAKLNSEQSISTSMRSKVLTKAGRLCLGGLSSEPGDEIFSRDLNFRLYCGRSNLGKTTAMPSSVFRLYTV